ncbi:hypothetical protein NBT05_03545 [Aquimarina sp. ERC-38]|uniref:hypothetical protein n=1 Tax=Aquimarina sp. ERC-38 TaxID=2949996 RepID=UPI0022483499|nr:hypothetical protein [Aquimarina sp. ERC-38]UZO81555.1 hypothetical protein NBT05_03545 [Aquimarina sp. ERC-38]
MYSRIVVLLYVICLYSCNQFQLVKEDKKEEVLKEEWDKITKESVEEPPLFAVCTMVSEEKQDSCFAAQIHSHIQQKIKKDKLYFTKNRMDTLWITLLINKDARITYKDFELPPYLKKHYPEFKKRLKEGIYTLPKLLPATKRGVPTNIKYRLPVLIPVE